MKGLVNGPSKTVDVATFLFYFTGLTVSSFKTFSLKSQLHSLKSHKCHKLKNKNARLIFFQTLAFTIHHH